MHHDLFVGLLRALAQKARRVFLGERIRQDLDALGCFDDGETVHLQHREQHATHIPAPERRTAIDGDLSLHLRVEHHGLVEIGTGPAHEFTHIGIFESEVEGVGGARIP